MCRDNLLCLFNLMLFIPVGRQRFPELHSVVCVDVAVLGGVSQWTS